MKKTVVFSFFCLLFISSIFAYEKIVLTFSRPQKDGKKIELTFRWKNPQGVTEQMSVSVAVDTNFDADAKAEEIEGQIELELKNMVHRPFSVSAKDGQVTLEASEGYDLKKPGTADNTDEPTDDIDYPTVVGYALDMLELRGEPCGYSQQGELAMVRFGPKGRVIEVETLGKTRKEIIDTFAAGFTHLGIPVVYKTDSKIVILVRYFGEYGISHGDNDCTMGRYIDGVDITDWPDPEVVQEVKALLFD